MSKIRDAVSALEDLVKDIVDYPGTQIEAIKQLDTITLELDEIENELDAIITDYQSQIEVAKKLKDKVY